MSDAAMSDAASDGCRVSDGASNLLNTLREYRQQFRIAADSYDGSTSQAAKLERLTSAYSALVTDEHNSELLSELETAQTAGLPDLIDDLRSLSAQCVAVAEKYRALNLLSGQAETCGYFTNIESCIEEEFGTLRPTAASRVLLVGSGSYPMTLLNLAERTGAACVGVDIDAEAVEIGRRVVQRVGHGLDITLDHVTVDDLPSAEDATHIIFSSTVAAKYDLLQRIHAATRHDVVVAMRFGDGLKSLFNFPMQEVDHSRWRLSETVCQPEQVFDVAVYLKQLSGAEGR